MQGFGGLDLGQSCAASDQPTAGGPGKAESRLSVEGNGSPVTSAISTNFDILI